MKRVLAKDMEMPSLQFEGRKIIKKGISTPKDIKLNVMRRKVSDKLPSFQYAEKDQLQRKEFHNLQDDLSPLPRNFINGREMYEIHDDEDPLSISPNIKIKEPLHKTKKVQIANGKTVNSISINSVIHNYKEEWKGLSEEQKVVKKLLHESNTENMEVKKQMKLKEQQIHLLDKEIEELKFLNKELEQNVIKKIDVFNDIVGQQGLSFNVAEDNSVGIPVGQYSLDKSKIHMGRDIWILADRYRKACAGISTLPQFVKKLATIVFGKETLLKSIVSGLGSNRNQQSKIPEEALDGVTLLAIRDMYSFKLQKDHGFNRINADLEATNIFKYISKHISDMKTPPHPRKRIGLGVKNSLRIGKRLVIDAVVEEDSSDVEEEVDNDQAEIEDCNDPKENEVSKDPLEHQDFVLDTENAVLSDSTQ